jgi:hypothetical protein
MAQNVQIKSPCYYVTLFTNRGSYKLFKKIVEHFSELCYIEV